MLLNSGLGLLSTHATASCAAAADQHCGKEAFTEAAHDATHPPMCPTHSIGRALPPQETGSDAGCVAEAGLS